MAETSTTSATKHVCMECGETEDVSRWMPRCGKRLAERQLCFSCDHWMSLIERGNGVDRGRVVRHDGTHYIIGPEHNGPSHLRGLGGARMVIKFHDGREAVTTNLWCQGVIPERFRSRLPDNASFALAGAPDV